MLRAPAARWTVAAESIAAPAPSHASRGPSLATGWGVWGQLLTRDNLLRQAGVWRQCRAPVVRGTSDAARRGGCRCRHDTRHVVLPPSSTLRPSGRFRDRLQEPGSVLIVPTDRPPLIPPRRPILDRIFELHSHRTCHARVPADRKQSVTCQELTPASTGSFTPAGRDILHVPQNSGIADRASRNNWLKSQLMNRIAVWNLVCEARFLCGVVK